MMKLMKSIVACFCLVLMTGCVVNKELDNLIKSPCSCVENTINYG